MLSNRETMAGNQELHKCLLDKIEQYREDAVNLLCELIRIPSVFPPGRYEEISRRMLAEYAAIAIPARTVCAPREPVEAAGLEYPRPNVVALLEGSGPGPVLMIGTHMDVVDAESPEEWHDAPFSGVVRDGCIWGRGSADAKCAMVAQVFVARVLRECGVQLKGSLLLVSSVDDEGRFDRLKWPGMTYLAESGLREAGFPMPDMVINGEASGLEKISGSFMGRIILEIPVLGETAHAATPYGVNAIEKARVLIEELHRIPLMESPLQGRESLTICAIEGVAKRFGDIPPICKVGVEIRVVAPHLTDRILGEIRDRIQKLQSLDPTFRCGEIHIHSDRQPLETPSDHLLIRAIEEAARAVGVNAEYAGILGTGELQAFVAQGIAGVTYGAGHIERVHKANEFVTIDELLNQIRIYALATVNACGVV